MTQIRQRLREEALAQANHAKQDDEDVNYQRLARKMHRGYFKKPAKEPANDELKADVSLIEQRKGRRRPILKPEEKLAIVYAILIEYQEVKYVAKQYRVSPATVNQLVQKAKKKPEFVSELFSRTDMKNTKNDRVEAVVQKLIDEDVFIDSTKMVVEKVREQDSPVEAISVTENQAREVMKDMKMKYRKVNHIAMSANSQRSLVLRQQWAVTLLRQNPINKVLLNLDESWLGMSDFRRRKWQSPASKNSVAAFQMTPRVTMLTAVDTTGNVYLALA